MFRAFDTDVDGYVSFEEVIVGFHHLSGGGDEKEKLKIVFRVRRSNIVIVGKSDTTFNPFFQVYDTDNNRVLCPANVKE